jgi:hypothetical protein
MLFRIAGEMIPDVDDRLLEGLLVPLEAAAFALFAFLFRLRRADLDTGLLGSLMLATPCNDTAGASVKAKTPSFA